MSNERGLRDRLEGRIGEIADRHQRAMLNAAELVLGQHPNWRNIRSQLLRVLGERGLRLELREAVSAEFETKQSVNQ